MTKSRLKHLLGSVTCVALMAAAGSAGAFPKPKFPVRMEDVKPGQPLPDEPASLSIPKPKYPVRKDDKPAPSAAPAPQAAAPSAAPVEESASEVPMRAPVGRVDAAPITPAPYGATGADAGEGDGAEAPAAAPQRAPAPTHAVARPSTTLVYTVRSGDTLSGLGRRFGVTVKGVAQINDLDPGAGLMAGRTLRLPPEAKDKGEDPHATGTVSAVQDRTRIADATPVRPASTPAKGQGAPVRAVVPGLGSPAVASSGSTSTTPTPPLATSLATATPAASATSTAAFPGEGELRTLGRSRFAWPVRGEIVSRYGSLGPGLRNDGLNIGAPQGSAVTAAAPGEVVYAGSSIPGFGNLVLIKHADGWVTAYAHLSSIAVHMRDRVSQNQPIGAVGETGGVDRPQLHFEVRYTPTPTVKARPIDPMLVLP
jgi:murein DD-endopeptidase MepM/ murein hydrolase activator NlpD